MIALKQWGFSRCASVLLGVLIVAPSLTWAQQSSAGLTGVVRDRQEAVVPNAKIRILNQEQGAVTRELVSEADGAFRILALNPATYTLAIEASGFKKFEQKDIKLFPGDRVDLGALVLDIGTLSETVTVEARTVQLETESGARSGIVTGTQIVDIALNGRNYMDLVKTTPGVVSFFNGQTAGVAGPGDIRVNGQRGTQNTLGLDGVSNIDAGNNATQHTSLNVDAVAEMRIVTNGQTAEYGRSAGAAINVVTKSGTRNFHGTGYWFHRNEGMNSNSWRNNYDNIQKSIYRYNYQGYNIGGPIYIPGKFNTQKNKLFFFWAQEWQNQLVPNGTTRLTLPTAAERTGDFSQTHYTDGSKVSILDPLNGKTPFPNNQIPQSRWNADGVKILSWYPLPNLAGQPSYNYQFATSDPYPRREIMIRGDYNISDKWRLFVRFIRDQDDRTSYTAWGTHNLPNGPMHVGFPGRSGIINLTAALSPTLTNEFVFGPSWNHVDVTPNESLTPNWYAKNYPMNYQSSLPFPNADRAGMLANWRFGGVPGAPSTNDRGLPFKNLNATFEFTDNLAKFYDKHLVKVGFYVQRQRKDQTSFANTEGIIQFQADSNNPSDSNWAYSNALLGNYQTLQQWSEVKVGMYRSTNTEWYVADTWKVRPNLTLDLGLRFYIVQPQYDARLQTSSFNPALWDSKQSAILYLKARNPQGQIAAQDPVTGQYYPASFVGAIVPGTGKRINGIYANGMAQAGQNGYPRGMIESQGVLYAPRLGIAWKFAPKSVLRMGGGVFYDRFQGNMIYDQLSNPPGVVNPTLYYGNLDNISAGQTVQFPGSMWSISKDGKVTNVYNYNVGIQHELPLGIILDAAYVGSVSGHLLRVYDLNRPGFGSSWLARNQDPTVAAPKFDGTTTLPVNMLRPYPGYGSITAYEFGGTSNYNGLQVSVNRRLSKGIQFGLAYTYSKALGTTGGDWDSAHPTNIRQGMYAPLDFDRRHNLVFNYIYNTPALFKQGTGVGSRLARAAFNRWTISGITVMTTGAPLAVGYSIIGVSSLASVYTGDSTWGPRIAPTGQNPYADKSSKYAYLNPAAFAPATKPSVGLESALRGYIYAPGSMNWDVSLLKSFPFSKEQRRFIQTRLELFNAPNHPNYNGLATGLTFDNTGKVTNLPASLAPAAARFGFGTVAGSGNRTVQIGAKLYF